MWVKINRNESINLRNAIEIAVLLRRGESYGLFAFYGEELAQKKEIWRGAEADCQQLHELILEWDFSQSFRVEAWEQMLAGYEEEAPTS